MGRSTTIRDVATLAGVSIATVSHYMNGTKPLTPATAARVAAAIDDLQFVPNRLVRTLRGASHSTVGLLVPDTANPFFAEIAKGAEAVLSAAGYLLVLCDTGGARHQEAEYLQKLAEMRVAGVIGDFGGRTRVDSSALTAVGSHLVLLGSSVPRGATSVTVDQHRAGAAAAHHLLDLGHERIVFVATPGSEAIIQARWTALVAAAQERGLSPSQVRRLDVSEDSTAAHVAVVDDILALRPRPTAVIGANDVLALNMLHTLLRSGIGVPSELSVMGFDDIAAAGLAYVSLTTMRAPAREMGAAAAELLLRAAQHQTDHAEHRRFESELVIRESTSAPKA